jgi:hypothetical protein
MINQCQKMLAPLKLSSRAVHVGKFVDSLFSDRNVDQVTISGANLLQRVIGECYAPLLSLIASTEKKSPSTVPSNGKASRLEMAQDCYIRAAMLADQLDSWTSTPLSAASGFRMSADEALRRVYKLAVGSSDENAIMVAKSIGALGKQRIERQVRSFCYAVSNNEINVDALLCNIPHASLSLPPYIEHDKRNSADAALRGNLCFSIRDILQLILQAPHSVSAAVQSI